MSVGQILLPLRVLFVLTTGLSLVELRPLVARQWSIPFALKYVVKVPVQHLWLLAEKKRAGRQRYLPGSSKSHSVVDYASMISILGTFVIRCRCRIPVHFVKEAAHGLRHGTGARQFLNRRAIIKSINIVRTARWRLVRFEAFGLCLPAPTINIL